MQNWFKNEKIAAKKILIQNNYPVAEKFCYFVFLMQLQENRSAANVIKQLYGTVNL